jgi:L-ascorbate metabolism protein UlaG (beta-lactamase superfamily)
MGLSTITGIPIRGIPTYRNPQILSVDGMNLTYTWIMDGMRFCFLGRQSKPFDADQLAQMGEVDILFLPMDSLGGESRQAVLSQLQPKVVIPMGSAGSWSHGDVRGVQGTTVTFSRQMLPAQPVTLAFNR